VLAIIYGQAEQLTVESTVRPIVVGILFGIVMALTYSLQKGEQSYLEKLKRNIPSALGYSVPVALIGYIAGYLTGVSRAPAVGTIVPAILALMGGMNIYFFGTESRNRALVAYSVSIFSFVFFYGVWGGVLDRENGRVGRLINLSEQEKTVRTYRENRDLPPEPPAWMLGNDPR
jgi:hypothetical protein